MLAESPLVSFSFDKSKLFASPDTSPVTVNFLPGEAVPIPKFPELDIVNLLELASKSAIKNSPALLLPNSYFFPLVAQTHRL